MAYSPASIIAISVVLPLLALVAVILRFWVRLRLAPSFIGIDDWLAVAAVVFALADGANLIVAAVIGIQGHAFPPDQIPRDRAAVEAKVRPPPSSRRPAQTNPQPQSDYAQVIIEKPLYAMMKLSMLFFYRRIFKVQPRFRAWNDVLIALISAWGLAYLLAEIFACGGGPPRTPLWTSAGEGGDRRCVNLTALNLTFSVTDVVTDVLVVVTPFPLVRRLKMRARERAGLASIFALALLSTAAAIVRLGFIAKAAAMEAAGGQHANGAAPAVWSTVEGSIGVLACCLPPLGPLIRREAKGAKQGVEQFYRYVHGSHDGGRYQSAERVGLRGHESAGTNARTEREDKERDDEHEIGVGL